MQNHFAFARSFNRSIVSDKIMTMFESTKKTAQRKFMGVLDALNYSERASPNVQSVYTYLPSKKKIQNYYSEKFYQACFQREGNLERWLSQLIIFA